MELENLEARDKMPELKGLTKHNNTDPPKWELHINEGLSVMVTMEQLVNYRFTRNKIGDATMVLMPSMKNDEWERIIRPMMYSAQIAEAPEDAGPVGIIRIRLEEFIRKADFDSPGDDIKDRESILRGMPVVTYYQGVKVVMFRGVDFTNYLRLTKADIGTSADLWFRFKKALGGDNDRVKIRGQLVQVWYVPVPVDDEKPTVPDFTPEY
jgi:hypothetical protein